MTAIARRWCLKKWLQLPTPVLHLVMLDSDRSGGFIAAVTAMKTWRHRMHCLTKRCSRCGWVATAASAVV